MKFRLFLFFSIFLICGSLFATELDSLNLGDYVGDKLKKEKQDKKKKEKTQDSVRKGWTFGILPSVSYDADRGFEGGVVADVYYFGDGSTYPEYLHSFYFEASYTTKHCGIFRINYDSKYLIPKHWINIDVTYLPDAIKDFVGYNGYQSVYNYEWCNKNSENYKSTAFYKHHRDMLRIAGDLSGKIDGNWHWIAGLGLQAFYANSADIDMLNRGKRPENRIQYGIEGMYEKYVKWGIIGEEEIGSGWFPYIRGGVKYDSRNQIQNPSKGIYADVFLTYTAAFGAQKKFNNLVLNADFKHYVPIYKDYVAFAYRVSLQVLTAGNSPYYLNNILNSPFPQRVIYESLGGCNSLRGITRNRITADGFAFTNIEFRFKLCKFTIAKEHFYIGMNPFLDGGMVVIPKKLNEQEIRENIAQNDPTFDISTLDQYILFDNAQVYRPHLSAGVGLKIAMNENFVLSVDWAAPFDKRDNGSLANFYVNLNYMF